MVKLDRIEHIVTIPEGVTADISEDGVVTISGPKGSLSRSFESDVVQLFQDGSGLVVRVDLPRRKQRALAGTWNAHLNNMVKGVTDGFTYNLKAFYSHFPMTFAVNGNTFQVNNYFGERVPRTAHILDNVKLQALVARDVFHLTETRLGLVVGSPRPSAQPARRRWCRPCW